MLVRDRQRMRARSFGGGGGPAALSAEYVVVAGGGGTANTSSFMLDHVTGGGGGGGYRSSVIGESSGGGASAEAPFVPLLGYAYPLTVGAGGTFTGLTSQLGTVISGGGGGAGQETGGPGGSGGGAAALRSASTGLSSAYSGGAGTAGQGFDGGDGDFAAAYAYASGGGGGASEAGENGGSVTKGGDGGDGLITNITGTPIALAGGGGGSNLVQLGYGTAVRGEGGLGGGAQGARYTGSSTNVYSSSVSGTANTGGGAGGGLSRNAQNVGASGGSGRILFKVESKYDPDITITPGVVYTTTTVGDHTVYDVTAAGSTDRITFGTQTDFAWSLANPSYSGDSLDLTGQTTVPIAMTFSPDGSQVWVTGYTDETIYEYAMSTPYDIANATFVQSATFTSGTSIRAFRWKSDGTSLFTTTNSPTGRLYEYSVSTPYDISTRNATPIKTHSFGTTLFEDIDFSPDGTKMWGMASNDRLYEYALSTPWDISTETLVTNISTLSFDVSMATIKWKPDGARYYLTGVSTDKVFEFIAPSSFSITGAFLANDYYIGTQVTNPYGIDFKSDGTEMFVCDFGSDYIYKYDLIP